MHLQALWVQTRSIYPGFLLSAIMALAAQYVADHYGAPSMLMALLFGMSMSSLSGEHTAVTAGIKFTSAYILKLGIILLGSRISTDIITMLGWQTITMVVAAMMGTIAFGYLVGKSLKKTSAFAVLTAGAVAICGASAAIAISSILPRDSESEKNLLFTILCVTVLSTVAMIVYPVLVGAVGYNNTNAGIFLGATIHDVAQVVGAGFSVSDEVGETATLVKLMRVTLLVPIVIGLSILFREKKSDVLTGSKGPSFPLFIVGFILLAGLNSLGVLSETIKVVVGELSRWALLTAIVAAGAKTNLKQILSFGLGATFLVIIETVFLAGVVLVSLLIWFQ